MNHGGRAAALLAASATAAALFTLFASGVARGLRASIDEIFQRDAGAVQAGWADSVFGAITYLGWTPVLSAIAVVAALLLWRVRSVRPAVPVVASPIVAMLVADALKDYFARVRPTGIDMMGRSFSFPSGHATGLAAVALTLAYVCVRERVAGRWSWLVASGLALLVGASRVYLGQHHASDVLAGWVVGVGVAAACCALYERLEQANRR